MGHKIRYPRKLTPKVSKRTPEGVGQLWHPSILWSEREMSMVLCCFACIGGSAGVQRGRESAIVRSAAFELTRRYAHINVCVFLS